MCSISFHLSFLVLEKGLRENFEDVTVSVVECPDLTLSPWQLAAPGEGGVCEEREGGRN